MQTRQPTKDDLPFKVVTVNDGGPAQAFEIPCCQCDHVLYAVRPKHLRAAKRVSIEHKLAVETLEKAGWTYKKGFRRPTCPDHTPPEEEQPVPPETINNVLELKADAPRVPTLDQRRKVLEALDMAYNVDKGCYNKGHSDDAVAKTLNVPRKWVSDVREQFFGLNEKSEDFAETVAALKALKSRIDDIEKNVFTKLEELDICRKELAKLLDNLK